MLSSTTNIKIVIEYLHWIQNNIEMIQDMTRKWFDAVEVDLPVGLYEFNPTLGLCDNILFDHLDELEIDTMFLEWAECNNERYPCGDRDDFLNDRNLYRNPKRLRLIKHCIKYLQAELEKRDAQED